MENKPWKDTERRLSRRIRTAQLYAEATRWIPLGLLAWGLTVFVIRYVAPEHTSFGWIGGVFLLGAVLFSLYSGWNRGNEVNTTAVLDHLAGTDNLLVSLEETNSTQEEWRSTVSQKLHENEWSMPQLRWKPLFTSVAPALLFLLLIWFVPLSGPATGADSASNAYMKERVEDLRKKLNEAEQLQLVRKNKAKRLKKKLNELKADLEKQNEPDDNPWSVLDRVDKEIENAMVESSEALNRARKAANQLSDRSKSDGSSDSSDSGQDREEINNQKEALARAMKQLSERGFNPGIPSNGSSGEKTNQNGQKKNPSGTKAKPKSGKSKAKKWKKLASRRKKLNKHHKKMHRKSKCRGGMCQGLGRTRRKTVKSSSDKQDPSSSGPTPGPGPASMTWGNESEANSKKFQTKKVDGPIVDPEGYQKVNEKVRRGTNQKPGTSSTPKGGKGTVDQPLESTDKNVPPKYREAVKSYFSPEED